MATSIIQRINPPTLPTPPGYSQLAVAFGGSVIVIAGHERVGLVPLADRDPSSRHRRRPCSRLIAAAWWQPSTRCSGIARCSTGSFAPAVRPGTSSPGRDSAR